jgi:hypothetical protein
MLTATLFTKIVIKIRLLSDTGRDTSLLEHTGINLFLSKGFYEHWFDIEDGKLSDEPPDPLECSYISFGYCWLKVWFHAHQMSLDQLNEVQALANQEMLFIKHHLGGYGQSPSNFMPMILEHINLAIAIISNKAYESFIAMLLSCERRNAVLSRERRNADETHDAVFAVRIANLPSWALKLIGETLFKKYKNVQADQDAMNFARFFIVRED